MEKLLPSEYLEQGWCQGACRRDEDGGLSTNSGKPTVAWCLMGSASEGLDHNSDFYYQFLNAAYQLIGGEVPKWNDSSTRTQAEVVALARCVEIKLGLRSESADAVEELEYATV